jgi:hypothetical protein
MHANELGAQAVAEDLDLPVKESLAEYQIRQDPIDSETEQRRRSEQDPKVVQVDILKEWPQGLDCDPATVTNIPDDVKEQVKERVDRFNREVIRDSDFSRMHTPPQVVK